MESSQHLLVLTSIILGFGIMELMNGARTAAMGRAAVGWTPYLAGLLVLIALVQFWWYAFIVAERGGWSGNFFVFAASLLPPTLLYLSASSIFPERGADEQTAAGHYIANRRFIWLPLVVFEGQNLIESAANLGTIRHPAHLFHLAFMLIPLVLAFSTVPRTHRVGVGLMLVMAAVFIGVFSLTLG